MDRAEEMQLARFLTEAATFSSMINHPATSSLAINSASKKSWPVTPKSIVSMLGNSLLSGLPMMGPVKILLAGIAASGALVVSTMAPALAFDFVGGPPPLMNTSGRVSDKVGDLPVRWNTGGAVWSTNQSAMTTFFGSGSITDRGLEGGLYRSGWTSEEVRQGMTKSYSVDLLGVSRFLYSDEGVKFLKNQTTSYFPYWGMTGTSVPALRSAIIADAVDGQISSATIMAKLPTNMRLADTCGTYTGAQNVCDQGSCKPGTGQCTSLFSWYVFLPACIQANQVLEPVAQARPAQPMPQQPVRGLW